MAQTTIQIGAGSGAFTFGVPVDFRPRVESIVNREGVRIGERHTWPVRGLLTGADETNVSSMWEEVVGLLSSGAASCYFKRGDTVLQTLSADEAERGPVFKRATVTPSGDNAWNGRLEFDFEITAEFYDAAGAVIDSESLTSYREKPGGAMERVTSGTLRTSFGESAKSEADALRPAVPPGWRMDGADVTVNADDTRAQYTFKLTTINVPLPSGVLTAERVEGVIEDGGEKRVTYRALFSGQGAETAADRRLEEAPYPVVRREKRVSVDSCEVEIVYTMLEPAGAGRMISFSESIEVEGPSREYREFPVDGRDPLVMRGARRAAVVVQKGFRIHRDEIPPGREPLERPGLVRVEPRGSVETGDLTYDAAVGTWKRTWEYRYLAITGDAARDLFGEAGGFR